MAAARDSYGKLIAFLSARSGDLAGAEDALAEAFESALRSWPQHGVPTTPEAWLLVVARRRMADAARRRRHDADAAQTLALTAELMDEAIGLEAVPDERLRLMFACAHPAIERSAHAPLMLQAVLGLDAAAIASAFLVAPSAMSQRLVRAKAKIRQAGIAFEVPRRERLAERIDGLLDAVYAGYTQGWAEPAGEPLRRDLADEAIWLGRVLAALLPDQPEVLGLLALMLYAQSRQTARRNAEGDYVPLDLQDTAAWDAALVDEAESLLRRAAGHTRAGRYQLEAALQSAHMARRHGAPTDWAAIESLYEALHRLTASPVVALNHAVALARVQGAAAGLRALQSLQADGRLASYQPYWAALAQLQQQAGDSRAAALAYEQAIGLAADPAVRRFLQRCRQRLSEAE
jgi:RNA polymerase sigma-70 factor (ECF subfamily)